MLLRKLAPVSLLTLLCSTGILSIQQRVAAELVDITAPGNIIVSVPSGGSPDDEGPDNAIDDNSGEKYLRYLVDGESEGLSVTPSQPELVVVALTITTANDWSDRDPISFELYGSNSSISGPYTLIDSGAITELAQVEPLARYTKISPIEINNGTPYAHYKLLFPDVRNSGGGCVQVGEIELLGTESGDWPPTVDAGEGRVLVLPSHRMALEPDLFLYGDTTLDDVTLTWGVEGGPSGVAAEDVSFLPDAHALNAIVDLPAAGRYILSLTAETASDVVSDTLTIILSDSLCPTGDVTDDCVVDMQDLTIIANKWLSSGVDVPDLDGDSDTNGIGDFAVMAENWQKHGPKAVISEFMAVNTAKYPAGENELLDEDNDSSDWIELCNPTDEEVDLAGWYLTNDEDDLKQWMIPELKLAPEEFCIIFASGKDRDVVGEQLHTNFSISSNPEYLALVEPDGKTVAHEYRYPAQYGLLSYGLASPDVQPSEEYELVSEGDAVQALVPSDGILGDSWLSPDYVPTGWLNGTTGVAYENKPGQYYDYTSLTGTNVISMYGNNSTVYIRIPFNVYDLTGLSELILSMKYDDGFVAYINGVEVASSHKPETLDWEASASIKNDDNNAVIYEDFILGPEAIANLRIGQNVLAIHGLNENTTSSDFLIMPVLTTKQDHAISVTSMVPAYFPTATPGGQNGAGLMDLGPIVRDVTRNPDAPLATEDLVITAEVSKTKQELGTVDMVYRIGFSNEVTVGMNDSGIDGDEVAGDGVYSAIIPASAYNAGNMIRWYVKAYDDQGSVTRDPIYLLDENSPQYYGTVAEDPTIETNLNIFRYYLQDLTAANLDSGTRCCVYYKGEFYDNVFVGRRGGNTTSGRKFKFNDGEHFRFDDDYERVDEINLNERGNDPTYLRPMLAFPTYEGAGVACSKVELWHVIRNNSYLDVRLFVEQPDRHLLRRVGLDDEGSFYKVYSDLSYGYPDEKGDEQVERKITRLDEDNSDLYALRAGISPSNPDKNTYLFDNVNIPAVISYLAVCTLVHENDHTHKNYFLYQDTNNTGEWMFIPWDKDLTFGLNNGIGGIIADEDWPTDLQHSPSHPFYGSERHQKIDDQWNRLFDAIYADPTSREMYVRRLRTLMDTYLQAPGTPVEECYYENRIAELRDLVSLDLTSNYVITYTLLIGRDYLPVRREHLYVNHLHGSNWPDDPAGIPDAQPETFSLQFGAIEFCPSSWNQDEEYIELVNPNNFAADISGWKLSGGVKHKFPGGTVIPANSSMYLTPNALAFRSRAVSPTGGEHRFVQGNYKGHLSSWGEELVITDANDNVVVSTTYAGAPSDQQKYLRITELMYNAEAPTDPELSDSDYEYVELLNTGTETLSLDGVEFVDGISYVFPSDTVLGGGEYLLLVKNFEAFVSRYDVPGDVRILSGYEGNLSNGGEKLELADETHSSILEFEYKDGWYEITDGLGYSLVFSGDLAGDPSIWDEKESWRASTFVNGSPGTIEQGLSADSIVFNELLAHSHALSPDWIELYNTTGNDINIGGWFLSDDDSDLDSIRKYEIPANTIIAANGYVVFSQDTSFGSGFGLSEAGETVYLYSGENGEVTGYYQCQQKFDASDTGITFGRYEKPSLKDGYDFVRMSTSTPMAANSGPDIANVIITELMYDPAEGTDAEYVELYNRSGSPVPLMSEAGTESADGTVTLEMLPWRVEGTGYEFDNDVVLAPYEFIILAKDPDTFNTVYGDIVASGTRVFGPYDGKLSNGGEDIEIQMPGDEEYGDDRIYIPIEKVDYSDSQPWPEDLEDLGYSLGRIDFGLFSDDPENWQGQSPTPGN